MSAKASLAALIGGVVLALGSCAPLGFSAYRTFFVESASATPLQVGVSGRSGTVSVPPGKLARIAVMAEIQTASVQEVESYGRTEYKPRYRFPLSYTVASGGRVLHGAKQLVAWNEGDRVTSDEQANSAGATLTVRQSFDKFAVPASGAIDVEARLDEDSTYGAKIRKLELLVYGGLENEAPYVVAGVAMLVAGFVLAIVGLVFLLSAVAASSTVGVSAGAVTGGAHAPAVPAAEPNAEARRRAMLCHLSGFLGYVVPFANVIVPAALWMMWRDTDEFVREQGREALNFQISVLIYFVVSLLLIVLLIGFLLLVAVGVFQIAFMLAAAVAASKGRPFRYPITLRLIQ